MAAINLKNSQTYYIKVASSASSVPLLAETGHRTGLLIYNNSSANLFIMVNGDASTNDFSIKLSPNTLYVMPENYFTDAISGVWDSVNGFAHITEIRS